MKQLLWLPLCLLPLTACGQKDEIYDDYTGKTVEGHDHDHDGDGKPDHAADEHDDHEHGDHGHDHDHDHDEMPLGTMTIGEYQVECGQGHGPLVAGEESHLVVKLPFNDSGATIVRAWIGTADRTLSRVANGEYAASHDDYDVHAVAPIPLPEGVQWWVEIERPDGSKLTGSIQPQLP